MFDTPPQQASKERQSPKQPIVKYKTSFKNCVLKALKNRNWKEADDDNDWDIYWGEKETIQDLLDRTHLNPNQRVNHFRNHFELTKKDHLMRNLKKYKRQLEKDGKIEEAIAYDFFPMTYNLPLEYPIFCDEFKRNGNSVWIMKPIGRSQGKGIFLFNKLNQISNWKLENRWKSDTPVEDYVVQKYIANPLLIGGKKFDMRIYCLVTSYSPLTVYLYREGFARFTHHRYTNHDLTNTYVHLTNVAIQKTSENYDEKLGGKWELTKLKQYLVSKYGQDKIDECFLKIQSLVLQTIQSVQKIIINDKHCFELYGFDVLLDDTLKPWLLEVNGSPSMTSNTPQDARLKCALLNDVFTIIDIEKRLTGTEEKIGGFDLISKVSLSKPITVSSTLLGGLEDRADIFNMLIKEMVTSGAQLKAVQPERPLKSSGRILTTPNNKEKPGTPNSKEKSKENENMSAPKSSSTTENNFYTPKRSSSKIFLFDSTSIKTLTTENSTPETKPNLSSGRPKRILKALPQPVASIAQWKEMMMKDMKVVSQAVKVNQTSPKNQAKPATVMPPQQYITPLPFVNMTKALLEHEDPRALLPKKEPKSNQDSHRPFTAKSIKLVIQDERLTPKEGVRRVMMPEKKILRPSTTLGMMPNNSAVDLQGHKTSTQNNFNIFNTTMPGVKGTLADSLLIKQMKCEPLDDGEGGKTGKENKPHAPPGTPKNQEIKRPVKTCRIKLWSGKLNLQRKEEKESKAHEALNLAHSLKSSGLYKEIKVEGKV